MVFFFFFFWAIKENIIPVTNRNKSTYFVVYLSPVADRKLRETKFTTTTDVFQQTARQKKKKKKRRNTIQPPSIFIIK